MCSPTDDMTNPDNHDCAAVAAASGATTAELEAHRLERGHPIDRGPVNERGIPYAALNQVPPPTGLGEAEHVVRRYDVEAWSLYGPVESRTRRRVAVDHEPGADFVDDLLEVLEGSGWSVGIGDFRFTIHGQVSERVVDARTYRDA